MRPPSFPLISTFPRRGEGATYPPQIECRTPSLLHLISPHPSPLPEGEGVKHLGQGDA